MPIACGDPARARQTLLVYGPDGERVARYDKIHLFRFTHGDEDYDEAKTIVAGDAPTSFATPHGRVGLSICYDVAIPGALSRAGRRDADCRACGVHGANR